MTDDQHAADVLVRAFAEHDIEAVRTLWYATENLGLGDADSPAALQRFISDNPALSAVAVDRSNDAIAGAVLCGHDGRRGSLYHLAVAPAYRGRGVGKRLVAHCRAGLQRAGITRCNLLIYPDNGPGRAFWTACGWESKPWNIMQAVV